MQSFLDLYNDCSELQVSLQEKNVIKFLKISFKCYLVTLLSLKAKAKITLHGWLGLYSNLVAVFPNLK